MRYGLQSIGYEVGAENLRRPSRPLILRRCEPRVGLPGTVETALLGERLIENLSAQRDPKLPDVLPCKDKHDHCHSRHEGKLCIGQAVEFVIALHDDLLSGCHSYR